MVVNLHFNNLQFISILRRFFSPPKINFKKPSLVRLKEKEKLRYEICSCKIRSSYISFGETIAHMIQQNYFISFVLIAAQLRKQGETCSNLIIRVILLKHFTYFFLIYFIKESKSKVIVVETIETYSRSKKVWIGETWGQFFWFQREEILKRSSEMFCRGVVNPV